MTTSTIAYLALGSNLGDPIGQLVKSRAAIGAIPGVQIVRASSLYQSPAWGSDKPQPDYINAVISVQTMLSTHELWQETSRVEAMHGRVRDGTRNAARTLDIDLLLYGEAAIDTPDLTVPHPRIFERDFVLMPLIEISPELVIPGHGIALHCLQRIKSAGIRKLSHNSSWN